MFKKKDIWILLFSLIVFSANAQIAGEKDYLKEIKNELQKQWPENRTVNLVFHGHSVPTGYTKTPIVNTLQAYPHQTLDSVKPYYPFAVINVITTSIGGENSEQGELRFENEVLTHRPDVIFIDYALNDRGLGLDCAKEAWEKMICKALDSNIKVILLTPTPDTTTDMLDDTDDLAQHAQQIRNLAAKYHIGLTDSYAAFTELKQKGEDLNNYMSQHNHPNEKGHQVVCELILKWFQ
jgi:lysophospholipase L1-like esterase